jgi:hypothetical protein
MRLKAFCFLIVYVAAASCVCAQGFYNNTIKVSAQTYAQVKDVADDLQQYLNKATLQPFAINTKDTDATSGIVIIKLDRTKNAGYDKRLDARNEDAVLLQSDGSQYLKIVAYTRQGITNGIYTYLDTLGFRWYHPGEEWVKIPQLKSITLKCDLVYTPDFVLRTFFGTWGTPRNGAVDKTASVDKQWNWWMKRTRMGGGYVLKGHSWNDFLWRNITVLQQHPEYMAMVGGKRVAPNTAQKFCISNKDLQQLFADDMVKQLRNMMKQNPDAINWCVSVEPSDGGGDCECEECRKLGSVSNRVFLLANLVAGEFSKISPDAYVNLYAYNTHAAPPDFDLAPNVLVQIIPYGYQSFSSPQQMIEAWKKKSNKLFIYDYYGLPIENVDMPLKGSLRPADFAGRIKYWHDQHIVGVTLESSYSIGATGLGLYLFSRLAWHVNSDVKGIIADYYTYCYGRAAPGIEKAQQVLASDTLSRNTALAEAMHIVHSATKKPLTDTLQNYRVAAYKAYMHYLKLLYDMQRMDAQHDTSSCDKLLRYVYSIHSTKMVHQFPINEWMINYGHSAGFVKQYWSTFKPYDPNMRFATVSQYTTRQINDVFDEDCREMKAD